MKTHQDTIVATATPPGRGGVAIVRISGPDVKKIAHSILKNIPIPRHASFHSFYDEAQQIIDQGIALYFPNPHSFTGEDVLELQGHGGPAVVNILIQAIIKLGARLAKPGEFSERAFLNGRIDLVQAEAIADLINATSEQAARSAMRSLQGEFSKKITAVTESLIKLRIFIEAAIDFVEEEIDLLTEKQFKKNINNLTEKLTQIINVANQGSLLREGIHVVITGLPNVGKSSLLNQLSGKDIAIVTSIPGTTRDILRNSIHIDGMPVHIIDTAGLRDSDDPVEQEGIRRAQHEIAHADMILWVTDNGIIPKEELSLDVNIIKQIHSRIEELPNNMTICIKNKIDLLNEPAQIHFQNKNTVIALSAKTGEGMDLLKNHIKSVVGLQTNEGVFLARQRHIDGLLLAKKYILQAEVQSIQKNSDLIAEDLRLAQRALSEIVGEFSSDDLLGRIFSQFCIGK